MQRQADLVKPGLQQSAEDLIKLTEENIPLIKKEIEKICDISTDDVAREEIKKNLKALLKRLAPQLQTSPPAENKAERERQDNLMNYLGSKIKLDIPFANEALIEILTVLASRHYRYFIDPMHIVAQYGNVHSLKTLIEKKGDVNSLNGRGLSPLDCAVIFNTSSIIQCLIDHKADARGPEQLDSPIIRICSNAQFCDVETNSVAVLLENKANPNAVNKDGKPIIHLVASAAKNDLISLLIDHKANIYSAIKTISSGRRGSSIQELSLFSPEYRLEDHVIALLTECDQEYKSGALAKIVYSFLSTLLAALVYPNDLVKIIMEYMSMELSTFYLMEYALTIPKIDSSININGARILVEFLKNPTLKDQFSKRIEAKAIDDKKSAPVPTSRKESSPINSRTSGSAAPSRQEECIMQEPPRRSYKR